MKAYTKICDVVFNIFKWIVVVLMMAMMIITFIEVIRRYMFHQNWVWSEVLVRYMIVWCTFFGGAAAYRAGSLTNFDLLTQRLGEKAQIVLQIICNIVILALVSWLVKLGLDTFMRPSIINQTITELGFSIRWIYIAIPIGFAGMGMAVVEKILLIFSEIIGSYRSKIGKEVDPS